MVTQEHGKAKIACKISPSPTAHTPHLCTDTGLISFFLQVLTWLFLINVSYDFHILAHSAKDDSKLEHT